MITKYIEYILEHIKNEEYNIGNYIIIKEQYLKYWKSKNLEVYKIAKIKGIKEGMSTQTYILDVIENDIINTYYLTTDSIERKIKNNDPEVSKLELLLNTNKYNI